MGNNINNVSLTGMLDINPANASIIGCGAIGSRIAIELARMGVNELELWDFDEVESHNLCNQMFLQSQVGLPKTEALKQLLKSICSIDVTQKGRFIKDSIPEHSIVFVCVDTMKTRKEIVPQIFNYSHVEALLETRMGKDEVKVYNLGIETNLERWEHTLCDDSSAEQSPCGTNISVGATAMLASALAVWEYIKLHRAKDKPEFEVVLGTSPYMGMYIEK